MKSNIRKQMIELRKNLSSKDKKRYDQSIVNQIIESALFNEAKTVSIFMPMKDEIDLTPLLKIKEKTFLIPRVDQDGMVFVIYDKKLKLRKSSFGILEPDINVEIFEDKIDYMMTPALAISKDFYRIGYGKGYYDQYISKNKPKKIIGVIYPFQLIDSFENDSFDQKMDGYIVGE